jgi:hypothetical protein
MNSISTESGEVSSNQGITIKEAMRQERVIFVHGIHVLCGQKVILYLIKALHGK